MRRAYTLSLAIVGIGVATQAQASILHFDQMAPGKYTDVYVSNYGNVEHVYAGAFDVHLDNNTPDFEAYCVDLAHWNHIGDSYGVTQQPTSVLGANGALVEAIYNAYSGSVSTADQGAALQIALWDALTDGGDGLSAGNFQTVNLDPAIVSLANAYLSTPVPPPATPYNTYVLQATDHPDGRFQDLITGSPTPEPASLLAISVGVVGILRRRAKKA